MGRGRQKAKHTKVARELKYYSPATDYAALERELTSHNDDEKPTDDAERWPEYSDDDDTAEDEDYVGEDTDDEDER